MVTKGERAPAFTLKNQDGADISLSDYIGKRVVLYFYPKDDTPGCTTEGREFSDLSDEFKKHNTAVFGVSKDNQESHKKFCEKYDFTIDLLSDGEGAVFEQYSAWREKNNYNKKSMGIVRSTVVINEEGIVMKHWETVQPQGHAQEVLDFLKNF